jgi:NifU-like protein
MLGTVSEPHSPRTAPPPAGTLESVVRAALDELRATLKRDGGDIELVAIDGDLIVIDMKGNCSACVLASVTLAGVRKRLIEAVGRPAKVVPRSAFAAMGMAPPVSARPA